MVYVFNMFTSSSVLPSLQAHSPALSAWSQVQAATQSARQVPRQCRALLPPFCPAPVLFAAHARKTAPGADCDKDPEKAEPSERPARYPILNYPSGPPSTSYQTAGL